MKLVVAVTGASGAPYARRLLEHLTPQSSVEVGLVFSDAGEQVWAHEVGTELAALPFARYGNRDFSAPFASGSARWDAMAVVPCSMGSLGRIAHGVSTDLIGRAADVMLKERRKLILVVRETPYSPLHLENMQRASAAGAMILPASPSFYSRPHGIDALLDTVLARLLDHLGIANDLVPRWGQAR